MLGLVEEIESLEPFFFKFSVKEKIKREEEIKIFIEEIWWEMVQSGAGLDSRSTISQRDLRFGLEVDDFGSGI